MSDRARVRGWVSHESRTGWNNAITAVPGVRVDHAALREEDGSPGEPVCTGVTVIDLPAAYRWRQRYFAGSAVANGFGQLTARDVVDT